MLNYLWAGMIIIGIIYGAFTGKMPDITNAALDSAKDAVTLCITMVGVMAFWMGIMEIASRAGIIEMASKKMRPLIRFLFPDAEALHEVNETLAKKMAGDGEGATALFEVTVRGADTKEQAKTLAKSVVCSNLTKAAIAGHDANWGRILCAMGYSGAEFDPEKVDLYFKSSAGELKIIENGVALDYSEEKATEILSMPEVTAIADLGQGEETATAWGCDLTHGYIDINADYRS